MKIIYTQNVTKPRVQIGKKGETKDIPDGDAKALISGGFAKEAKESTKIK